jgi:hypothetical protein
MATFDTILKTGESELAPKARIIQVVADTIATDAKANDATNAVKT